MRLETFVEFALHPQQETFRDSETQTKEDFKRKSRMRLRKYVNGIAMIGTVTMEPSDERNPSPGFI